jgi:hypothetical protein
MARYQPKLWHSPMGLLMFAALAGICALITGVALMFVAALGGAL